MKKIIFTICVLLACTGCANSGFTVNTLVSPATEKLEDPTEYYQDGFELTDQISRNAVDNLFDIQ